MRLSRVKTNRTLHGFRSGLTKKFLLFRAETQPAYQPIHPALYDTFQFPNKVKGVFGHLGLVAET